MTDSTARLSSGVWAGLAGPAAATLFFSSLVGFAALRSDDYTHSRKAVSELGAAGAPNAPLFNLFGFILPGLLIIMLGWRIRQVAGAGTPRSGPILLVLSGAAFGAAGLFPFELETRGSLLSTAHLVAAMLSGVLWALALFWIGPLFRRHLGLETLGTATPWFVLFLLANVLWQVAFQSGADIPPGWGQRLGFLGYFLWVTLAGLSLMTNTRPTSAQ